MHKPIHLESLLQVPWVGVMWMWMRTVWFSLFVALFSTPSALADQTTFSISFTPTQPNFGPFSFSYTLDGFGTPSTVFTLPSPITINSETITVGCENNLGQFAFADSAAGIICDPTSVTAIAGHTAFIMFGESPAAFIDTAPETLAYPNVIGQTSGSVFANIFGTGSVSVSTVSEPSSLVLLGTALALGILTRRLLF
jgi:hypothetical protein